MTIFAGMHLIFLRIYLFTVKGLFLTEVASMWDMTEFHRKKNSYQYTYTWWLLFSAFYNTCQVKSNPNKSGNYFDCLGTLFFYNNDDANTPPRKERSKQATKTNSSWQKLKTVIKNKIWVYWRWLLTLKKLTNKEL